MKNFATKFAATIAAAGLMASAFAPIASADVVNISHNGPFTLNAVNITKTYTKTAVQSNTAVFTNGVTSTSNTGGNTAMFNNGGGTLVLSGGSTTTVTITNTANSNVLSW